MSVTHKVHNFWLTYRSVPSVLSTVVLLGFIAAALLLPLFSSFNPLSTRIGVSLSAPSMLHPMGTDDLGRDVFSRFLYGARISFFIGSSSGLFTVLLGVSVGAFSGYYGGKIDYLLQKVTEIFLVFPRLILAMLFLFMFGTSLFNMVLVIAAFSWPRTARVVRGEALKLREAEFVEALRIMGVSNLNIIFREIMPNLLSSVVVLSSLEVAHAMLTEASLTYLGLGDPNVVSWGQMLFGAQAFSQSAPWLAVFPGLGIFLSVMSLNLIGDALNRTLNPRRRRREMTVLS